MKERPTANSNSAANDRQGTILHVLGVVAFFILFGMMIYVGGKLETLEDKLAYQPPSASVGSIASDMPARDIPKGASTIYVPVYSHIYATGGTPVLLETTLSIRNTDPDNVITISSIRYFDTKGILVQEYLSSDLQLGPLESTEVLIEKRDSRGGSGANFIVAWKSDIPIHQPLVEAIMVGKVGNMDISFLSSGRRLESRIVN